MFARTLQLILAVVIGLAVSLMAAPVKAATGYVAQAGQTPAAPYTNWNGAASNIQDAVAVRSNTLVLVSNGTYNITGANQITITNAMVLRSVNGASSTILKGNGTATSIVTFAATAANAVLAGFTITGGNHPAGADGGGGVYFMAACIVSNCVITNNYSVHYGGGVAFGVSGGTLVNCVIAGNEAGAGGGGVWAYLANGSLRNCTITGNKRTSEFGGGILTFQCNLLQINSIVYGNSPDNYGVESGGTLSWTNSCSSPLPAGGTNNISSDPKFLGAGSGYGLSHSNGNYHLTRSSFCVNAGTNMSWVTNNAVDLEGTRRIFMGIVDMGAYELPPPQGTLVSIR